MPKTAEVATYKTAASSAETMGQAVREAASLYDGKDVKAHAEYLAGALQRILNKKLLERPAEEAGTVLPAIPGGLASDVWLYGPFQAVGNPPYLPHKIIQTNEAAFFLAAFYRNPAIVPITTGLAVEYNVETLNLTSVTNGPDLVSGTHVFGPLNFEVVPVIVPAGSLPASPGKPSIYEVIMTMTAGPGNVLTAFSSWVFDPDTDPWGGATGWQFNQPARFLVRTP